MKRFLAVLLSAVIFLTPVIVSAQPSARFPDSVQLQVDGEIYRGFNLENFRALLHLDLDLQQALTNLEDQRGLAAALDLQVQDLRLAQTLTQESLTVLSADRERIYDLWEEQNRLLHECESKPRLFGALGWTVAAILAVVLSGVIISTTVSR